VAINQGVQTIKYILFRIKKRLEQELVILRYARWCCTSRVKSAFFILVFCVLGTSIFALRIDSVNDKATSKIVTQVGYEEREEVLPGGVRNKVEVGMIILSGDVFNSFSVTENEEAPSNVNDTVPQTAPEEAVRIVGKALNYPNPCRLGVEGTTIGYFLNKDAEVEIRIYDPFGNEIYKETFFESRNGGRMSDGTTDTYNRVSVTPAKLRTSNVPSGIYYFVILSEGRLLGKGKIAALP